MLIKLTLDEKSNNRLNSSAEEEDISGGARRERGHRVQVESSSRVTQQQQSYTQNSQINFQFRKALRYL